MKLYYGLLRIWYRITSFRLMLFKIRTFDHAVTRFAEVAQTAEENRYAAEQWQRFALAEAKTTYMILMSIRLAMDSPEVDIHEEVDAMIEEYRDQLARLTEQIVA